MYPNVTGMLVTVEMPRRKSRERQQTYNTAKPTADYEWGMIWYDMILWLDFLNQIEMWYDII